MQSLELLAPARDAETGRIAILAGADAVYIGAPAFGARAAATNDVASIRELASFAHKFGARVYVTMNTILYDSELAEAEKLVRELYAAGADALIVQDMAYTTMALPPIALHASTQCDIRTPEKAAWLANAGFSQLVLPREFGPEEIKAAHEAAGVPVEVFVHGALCVSYSGDCQAGCAAMGRSANRGECPQMCRLAYELVDKNGVAVAPEKHYLSLRDLNRSEHLAALIAAGASSFKIEGRLKDARYVANVTAAYSRELDRIIEASDGKYRRASFGKSICAFTPDLRRTFNRGYTDYFMAKPGTATRMASIETPKWAGVEVGRVTRAANRNGAFTARLTEELSNGDGLVYFDSEGRFHGFRLNRAEGSTLYPASPQPALAPGTRLYRNTDKAFFDLLDSRDAGCRRTIKVNFTLENIDAHSFAVTAADERDLSVCIVEQSDYTPATSPQTEGRRRTLSKTGDTIYTAGNIDDRLGDRFVPASVLTAARRRVLEALDRVAEASYKFERRKENTLPEDAFNSMAPTTYHDNIANECAARFYSEHGATVRDKAIEVKAPGKDKELCVMTTRYCLRRELGACLRDGSKAANRLPSPLFLRNPTGLYRLDFNCADCGMKVVRMPGK